MTFLRIVSFPPLSFVEHDLRANASPFVREWKTGTPFGHGFSQAAYDPA